MNQSGGSFYIKTFGCQMNAYDSSRMADLLTARSGYRPVDDPACADLIILNTCHVREKAEEKLFSELGRLRKLAGARKVIFAVGGCVGQAEGAGIFRRAPFVDLVFGPQNYHRLPELLERAGRGEGRLLEGSFPVDPKFDELPAPRVSGPVGSLTVQEGCDRFCSYCVVPFTRGREWSRPVEEIVAEAAALVAGGAREILLLGQNVNAYRSLGRDGVTYDLALLLRRLALVEGVERLRFVTSHPAEMSDDLVEVMGELPTLSPYLHLPIQSGSDRVLAAMERGHTVADYLGWVAKLRAAVPDLALASDFIVGFPGETGADFAATLEVVEEVGFDHAYSFAFSPRPGTPAAALEGQLGKEVIMERLERLQERLNAIQWRRNRAQVGRVEPVLVEGTARQGGGMVSGRTPGWRVVNFPGSPDLVGRVVRVEIVEGMPNSLQGRLLAEG